MCLKHGNNRGTCCLTSPLCFFSLQSFRQTKVKSNANLLEEASASTIQSIHFSIYSTQSMKYSTHQASGAVRPVTQPLRLPANAQHTHVLLERISQPDVRRISGTLHSFCGAATQTRKRVALHQFAELETSAWRIWHSAPQIIHVFFSRNGITCQKSSHRKNLASLKKITTQSSSNGDFLNGGYPYRIFH